jgi:hypothetical protein
VDAPAPLLALELVRDRARRARRPRVDAGMSTYGEREERPEDERGSEQHERDEQRGLLVVVTLFA